MSSLPAGPTLRAEIIGETRATCEGIEVQHNAPVLALCRALLADGYDPATPLEAYRGEVLCLKVRSIGEAAKLTVAETANGPRFVKYESPEDIKARFKRAAE